MNVAEGVAAQPSQSRTSRPKEKKLAKLPSNARVQKRPLLRPPIPSPYAGAQQQKVIYISTTTPFLSAVKRAEKLLHLAGKRLVQSAITEVQKRRGKRKDELLEIAETVERERKNGKVEGQRGGSEEVVLKGTGKAINKVMQMGLWFQQREEYVVKLRTGSVAAIDDVSIDKGDNEDECPDEGDEGAGDNTDAGDAMFDKAEDVSRRQGSKQKKSSAQDEKTEAVSGTRIRYTSVLEIGVSLA